MLYDADKLRAAAAVPNDRDVYPAHLDVFLDPHDSETIRQAKISGISDDFVTAAQQSPVYKMAIEWRVALPPHPEFRTLPMVWYVPPLSPMIPLSNRYLAEDGEIPEMRIPVAYLANLLSAGDEKPVRLALKRMLAVRQHMRSLHLNEEPDLVALNHARISTTTAEEMYHLFGIGKRADRFVIPTVRRETAEDLYSAQGETGFPKNDYDWR
jgi:nitrate reductase beta subunit